MASLVPRRRLRRIDAGPPGLLLVAIALLASCSAGASAAPDPALESRLCTLDDLGGGYQHQTTGDFDPGDLAARSGDPGARLRALRAAGLERGRLAFWKAALSKPPFDPPISVYCQVLQFGGEAQAAAFVASLTPMRDDLETTGLTFLPTGPLHIEEQPPQGRTRLFTIQHSDDWTVVVAIQQDGRFARSVYAGGRGVAPSPEAVLAVMDRVAAHATPD
jgi:hypothetical protein